MRQSSPASAMSISILRGCSVGLAGSLSEGRGRSADVLLDRRSLLGKDGSTEDPHRKSETADGEISAPSQFLKSSQSCSPESSGGEEVGDRPEEVRSTSMS